MNLSNRSGRSGIASFTALAVLAALFLTALLPAAASAADEKTVVETAGGNAGTTEVSTGELFEQARQAAWSGNREYARELCRRILERNPKHADARVLLGRTLAWDRRFDQARIELRTVLAAHPSYLDARAALIDVELWDGKPEEAARLCEEGLNDRPDASELLYRKYKALKKLGREEEALKAMRKAAAAEPGNRDFRRIVDRAEADGLRNKLAVWYRFENFEQSSSTWHETGVQIDRKYPWGTLIGRVTQAWRFGNSGQMFEVDAYPKLPNRFYMYLNAGVSGSNLFPNYRYGAELYKNFDGGWEASIGAFRMHFDSGIAKLYTGTIGKYWKNWWLSLRPTVSVRDPSNSVSWRFTGRRYFGDPENYAGFSVGTGSRPEFDFFTNLQQDLNSGRLQLEWQHRYRGRWIGKINAGSREQEFLNTPKRQSWFARFALEWLF